MKKNDDETTLVSGSPARVPTVISALPLETSVRAYLERDDAAGLGAFLGDQPPQDVADVVDRLSTDEAATVFGVLPPDAAAHVLSEMGVETANRVLDRLTPDQAADLLEQLPADDAATVLTDNVPEMSEALLSRMDPDAAEDIRALLRFPENSAGRLMTERFVRVKPAMTAAEVLAYLRTVERDDAETFSDLYVLDARGGLAGVVSLRQVVTADPDRRVAELMVTKVVTVAPTEDQETVARVVAHYDFMALPVVLDGRMLGIVTVDDVIDVLIEEGTEDALRFAGVEPGVVDQPYFTTPIWRVVRARLGWLVLLFVAETATGTVMRYFGDELAKVVTLAFFIPLLTGTGGNTGAQTVSTIIRGLALKEIRLRDTHRVVLRELGSGLLLGVLLGAIGFFRAELWGVGRQLALVVALTLVAICTWANTIGALIPLVAQRLKIDPALVSAPLITTLVDATGLAIYFLVAKALLTALH